MLAVAVVRIMVAKKTGEMKTTGEMKAIGVTKEVMTGEEEKTRAVIGA